MQALVPHAALGSPASMLRQPTACPRIKRMFANQGRVLCFGFRVQGLRFRVQGLRPHRSFKICPSRSRRCWSRVKCTLLHFDLARFRSSNRNPGSASLSRKKFIKGSPVAALKWKYFLNPPCAPYCTHPDPKPESRQPDLQVSLLPRAWCLDKTKAPGAILGHGRKAQRAQGAFAGHTRVRQKKHNAQQLMTTARFQQPRKMTPQSGSSNAARRCRTYGMRYLRPCYVPQAVVPVVRCGPCDIHMPRAAEGYLLGPLDGWNGWTGFAQMDRPYRRGMKSNHPGHDQFDTLNLQSSLNPKP